MGNLHLFFAILGICHTFLHIFFKGFFHLFFAYFLYMGFYNLVYIYIYIYCLYFCILFYLYYIIYIYLYILKKEEENKSPSLFIFSAQPFRFLLRSCLLFSFRCRVLQILLRFFFFYWHTVYSPYIVYYCLLY